MNRTLGKVICILLGLGIMIPGGILVSITYVVNSILAFFFVFAFAFLATTIPIAIWERI